MPKLGNLRNIRDAKFLSQRELAEKAGVSPTTINQLETGKAEAQPRTVRKLAEALGVEPGELVGES